MTDTIKPIKSKKARLNAELVKDYLIQHKNFFIKHPDILAEMNLPDKSQPGIVSLEQFQIAKLRDKTAKLTHDIKEILDIAQQNELLFLNCQSLALTLLEAEDLESMLVLTRLHMIELFDLEVASIVLLSENEKNDSEIFTKFDDDERALFEDLITDKQPFLGRVEESVLPFLFGDSDSEERNQAQSIAVIPISCDNVLGLLALGSPDINRFTPDMGTVFLSFTANLLSRLIDFHLQKPKAKSVLKLAD